MVKSKKKIKVNDIVMAIDRGVAYEAKVLKVQNVGIGFKYFIHYQQWGRKYDAWISDTLVSVKQGDSKSAAKQGNSKTSKAPKKTDADEKAVAIPSPERDMQTRKRSRDQSKATDMDANGDNSDKISENIEQEASKPSAKTRKILSQDNIELRPVASRRQVKALAESELCEDDDVDYRITAKINMPFQLKKFAVDEWSVIATTAPITDRKLTCLPRAHTFKDTIMKYLVDKKAKVQQDEFNAYVTFFYGLMLYFDRALPVILLYKQEREQYDMIREALPTLQPSEIYGCEHFNRLLVKFHRLMTGAIFPAGEEVNVLSKLSDFIKFIIADMEIYFDLGDYVLATEAMAVTSRLATTTMPNFFMNMNTSSPSSMMLDISNLTASGASNMASDGALSSVKKGKKGKGKEKGRKSG